MKQEKTFDAFGVTYRTQQFSAIEGLAMLAMDKEFANPEVMLSRTFAIVGAREIQLNNRFAINENVKDAAGVIPPLLVLRGLNSIVHDFTFSFLVQWKGMKVPSRVTDPAQSVSSKNMSPMAAQLIQDDAATLRELEEYYSLEDAFKMFDVLTAKGINQALSHEAATSKAKRK